MTGEPNETGSQIEALSKELELCKDKLTEREEELALLEELKLTERKEFNRKVRILKEKILSYEERYTWSLTAPFRVLGNSFKGVELLGRFFFGTPLSILKKIRIRAEKKLVGDSSLFDSKYYLERYPDVKASGVDPLSHFLSDGWKEWRNPSAQFSLKRYTEHHLDVLISNVNPLVHYLRYGKKEGREIFPVGLLEDGNGGGFGLPTNLTLLSRLPQKVLDKWPTAKDTLEIATPQIVDQLKGIFEKGSITSSDNNSINEVTVVVPVYNALEELKECVASILENTTAPYHLLLINDCSPDSEVAPFLDSLNGAPQITVLHNDQNLGFVRTSNRGMLHDSNDVVLLNSDTQVTKGWLRKLHQAAYSRERIGSVSPFSNAAGAFSIPVIGENLPIPLHLSLEEMGQLVERLSYRTYPAVPTTNGFCMFIRRAAIEEIGVFDEETFGRGYGEENDFCMRLLKATWENVLDDATFIYHQREASFGEEKQALAKKNRIALNQKHPEYTELVRKFVADSKIKAIRERLAREIDGENYTSAYGKKRVLYVLHQGGGGVPNTNLDLMSQLEDQQQSFLLTSDSRSVYLSLVHSKKLHLIREWKLEKPWSATAFSRDDLKAIYSEVLQTLHIDLVHVRHVFKHSFDIFAVASKQEVPYILSFHDFYLVHPFFHLLDQDGVFYPEGKPTSEIQWNVPTQLVEDCPQSEEFSELWKSKAWEAIQGAEALVTTSTTVEEIYLHHYPSIDRKKFHIIEHGQDFAEPARPSAPPINDEAIRIVFLGNMDFHKGSEVIQKLSRRDLDGERRLEFHFLGGKNDELRSIGTHHGTYSRGDVVRKIVALRPHFTGVFSICGETFSHTVTESWAAGVPVLGSPYGAVGERIGRHKGGWVVDLHDIDSLYKRILELAKDPKEYRAKTTAIEHLTLKDCQTMAQEYDHLYKEVLATKSDVVRVAAFLPEGLPGSTFIRQILPTTQSISRKELSIIWIDYSESYERAESRLREFKPEVILVQRNNLSRELLKVVEWSCSELSSALILDLDDDLEGIEESHPDFEKYELERSLVRELAIQSRSILTTTSLLKNKLQKRYGEKVSIVPNALDEQIWFAPMSQHHEDEDLKETDDVRVLYMGTHTHHEDLEMILPAIQQVDKKLSKHHGKRLQVTLLGVTKETSHLPDNVQPLGIPRSSKTYPEFVRFLRSQDAFDFAVAPLKGSSFNECKSELKYLEYTALGLPGIYSPVGGYPDAVTHRETGLLLDTNSAKEWEEALWELSTNPSLREELLEQALQDLVSRYLLSNVTSQFTEQIRSARPKKSALSLVASAG